MRYVLTLLLLFGCSLANAIPVTWTLEDAGFDDGGKLLGSFTFDVANNEYSNISVITTAGTILPGTDYQECFADDCSAFFLSGTFGGSAQLIRLYNESGPYGAFIAFSNRLTNSGGVVELSIFTNAFGFREGLGATGPERYIVSGYVSAVPIPAAVYLLGSGLGLLGWFRRRQFA
jgi:hypothetical protein